MNRTRVPRMLSRGIAGVIFGAGVLVAGSVARAQGTISGRVVARESGAPLGDAHVLALGTNATAVTSQDGRYTLRNVRAGSVEIQVLHVGYSAEKQTVTVTSGQATTADFQLTLAVVRLQDVVTTATGEQRKIELGNNIETLGDVTKRVEQTSMH